MRRLHVGRIPFQRRLSGILKRGPVLLLRQSWWQQHIMHGGSHGVIARFRFHPQCTNQVARATLNSKWKSWITLQHSDCVPPAHTDTDQLYLFDIAQGSQHFMKKKFPEFSLIFP